jgi:Luciferase-like monooxygenase
LTAADWREAWIDKAKRAESLGYSVVTIVDHMGDQLPLLVAREAATLDWLSEGGLELGIGAGWLTTDYEQLGIPYNPPGVPVERMAEALKLIRELLSGERRVAALLERSAGHISSNTDEAVACAGQTPCPASSTLRAQGD